MRNRCYNLWTDVQTEAPDERLEKIMLSVYDCWQGHKYGLICGNPAVTLADMPSWNER